MIYAFALLSFGRGQLIESVVSLECSESCSSCLTHEHPTKGRSKPAAPLFDFCADRDTIVDHGIGCEGTQRSGGGAFDALRR